MQCFCMAVASFLTLLDVLSICSPTWLVNFFYFIRNVLLCGPKINCCLSIHWSRQCCFVFHRSDFHLDWCWSWNFSFSDHCICTDCGSSGTMQEVCVSTCTTWRVVAYGCFRTVKVLCYFKWIHLAHHVFSDPKDFLHQQFPGWLHLHTEGGDPTPTSAGTQITGKISLKDVWVSLSWARVILLLFSKGLLFLRTAKKFLGVKKSVLFTWRQRVPCLSLAQKRRTPNDLFKPSLSQWYTTPSSLCRIAVPPGLVQPNRERPMRRRGNLRADGQDNRRPRQKPRGEDNRGHRARRDNQPNESPGEHQYTPLDRLQRSPRADAHPPPAPPHPTLPVPPPVSSSGDSGYTQPAFEAGTVSIFPEPYQPTDYLEIVGEGVAAQDRVWACELLGCVFVQLSDPLTKAVAA